MKRFAKAGTLLAIMIATMATAQGAAQAAGRCDEGHWPGTVQGKPSSFAAGGRAGYYVWHDSRGWHLRTTTPQRSPHPFAGTIASSSPIRLVHLYRDEGRDAVTVSGNKLTFEFVTYAGVDGVDFKVGCTETVGFSLKASDRPVSTSRIWLGARGHAPANPFRVSRVG